MPGIRSSIPFSTRPITLRKLHRWIGLPSALFLSILCLTGSFALLAPELDRWMQPELWNAAFHPVSPEALGKTAALLESRRGESENSAPFFLKLPSPSDPVLRLMRYDGRLFQSQAFDPLTGAPLKTGQTIGGSFFVTLHTALYMQNPAGRLLALLAGAAGIPALITGILLHWPRFGSDFLLFRRNGNAPRKWLDFHLLIGMTGFPVFLPVILSGIWLQYLALRPAPVSPPCPRAAFPARQMPQISSEIYKTLYAKGQEIWGTTGPGFFLPTLDGVRLFRSDQGAFLLSRPYLEAIKENVVSPPRLFLKPRTLAHGIKPFLHGLHTLRWTDLSVRWTFFSLGILTTLALDGGIWLYLARNRQKTGTNGPFSLSVKALWSVLVEAFALASLCGLPLAITGILYAGHFLPTALPGRIPLEVNLFFFLWTGSFLAGLAGALFRQTRAVWTMILNLLAGACTVFPLLDLFFLPPVHRPGFDAPFSLVFFCTGAGIFLGLAKRPSKKDPAAGHFGKE